MADETHEPNDRATQATPPRALPKPNTADPSAVRNPNDINAQLARLAAQEKARAALEKSLKADAEEAERIHKSPFMVKDARTALMLVAKGTRTEARTRFETLLESLNLPKDIRDMEEWKSAANYGSNSLQPVKAWIEYFHGEQYTGDEHNPNTDYTAAKQRLNLFDLATQEAQKYYAALPEETEQVRIDRALVAERDAQLQALTGKVHDAILEGSIPDKDHTFKQQLDLYKQTVFDAQALFDFAAEGIKSTQTIELQKGGMIRKAVTEPVISVNDLMPQVDAVLERFDNKSAVSSVRKEIENAAKGQAMGQRLDDGRQADEKRGWVR